MAKTSFLLPSTVKYPSLNIICILKRRFDLLNCFACSLADSHRYEFIFVGYRVSYLTIYPYKRWNSFSFPLICMNWSGYMKRSIGFLLLLKLKNHPQCTHTKTKQNKRIKLQVNSPPLHWQWLWQKGRSLAICYLNQVRMKVTLITIAWPL